MNLSLVISTLWIIYLTGITWRRFYQVGVLITRLNRNTSHVELEVFATWDIFFCMNIYRWLLCWSLNIDIAYNQDPESCANISPNSRHCSLIFCYSNFHHGFLFFFLVFISPTSFQSWYMYLLKYNPHLNKALLFVNALIIRFTERFIPLYKVRNFYCHSFLPICQTIDSVPIYRLWILKWDCVWIVKLKVTHNVCVLQFHPISCIIYPPFWAGKKQRTKGPMCVSKVFFSQLSTSWNRSPVIINFASPFNRYWDRGQMSHC